MPFEQTIDIRRPDAVYQQIADFFAAEISNGNLRENERLPSTTELARRFKVNPETIQQSLSLLTRRGLLTRTPGRGTFVRRGFGEQTVGIMFGREIFTLHDRLFFGSLLEALSEIVRNARWNYRLYPTSDAAEYDQSFHELKSAIDSGAIRAVIEFCTNDVAHGYFERECPIPVSHAPIVLDYRQMLMLGLDYLRARGARKIAVLMPPMPYEAPSLPDAFQALSVDFVRQPVKDKGATAMYRLFREYLTAAGKPDGVLLMEDSMFQPAILAIVQSGWSIPGDVKFITHANKGMEYFFSCPVTLLEIDPSRIAKLIWNQLLATLNGDKFEYEPVEAVLRKGESCGE